MIVERWEDGWFSFEEKWIRNNRSWFDWDRVKRNDIIRTICDESKCFSISDKDPIWSSISVSTCSNAPTDTINPIIMRCGAFRMNFKYICHYFACRRIPFTGTQWNRTNFRPSVQRYFFFFKHFHSANTAFYFEIHTKRYIRAPNEESVRRQWCTQTYSKFMPRSIPLMLKCGAHALLFN